jgi:hypothetical protein
MSKTKATMEKKPEATNGKSNKVEDNLSLREDIYYPPSAVAAVAAVTTAMKTLENTTNTIDNASSFPLNSEEEEDHTATAMYTSTNISAYYPPPPPHKYQPLPRDVILNDWDYGNPKFNKWIQEHREAFSLAATSLSAQTILIQGLIQVSSFWWKESPM